MGDSVFPRGECLKPFGSTWENVPALRALCSAMCFVFILLISTLISSVNFVEMDILTPPPSPLLLQLHHRGCGDIYNFIGDYDHQLSLSLGDREEPCCAVATYTFRYVISPCDYLYNSFSSTSQEGKRSDELCGLLQDSVVPATSPHFLRKCSGESKPHSHLCT